MQSNTYAAVDVYDINDANWIRMFIGVFAWFVYWVAVNLSYVFYVGGYVGYTTILFLLAGGFIIYSIITKNGYFYRLGFYCYSIYTIIMIIGDVFIILFIWFWIDVYEAIVGAALEIPTKNEKQDDGKEIAKDVVGWTLFGFRCLVTIPFIIIIITEICFVCYLRSRIKYFDAYAQYSMKLAQSSQNTIGTQPIPMAYPV